MSQNVLDMIDNVVAQHGDAMRWSPDAEPVLPPLLVNPHDLEAVRQEFARISVHLNEQLALAMEGFGVIAEAFRKALKPFEPFLAAVEQVQRERRDRLRRMRSAYPKKWRRP